MDLALSKDLATAIEPWVIGSLGIYIALNQWKISKRQVDVAANRLKFDLFEKRFKVYEAARTFLAGIGMSGKVEEAHVREYFVAIREAKWVLSDDIDEYLTKSIYREALKLHLLEAKLNTMAPSDERAKAATRQVELLDYFYQQHTVMDEKFGPYLRLTG